MNWKSDPTFKNSMNVPSSPKKAPFYAWHYRLSLYLAETKVCETAAVQAVSPYARRADSDDLIDIDDDEFQTVSSVIRGRAKLADVNHVGLIGILSVGYI